MTRTSDPTPAAPPAPGRPDEAYRLAFERAGTGMALVTARGRIVQVNEALCGLLGYRSEDLRGRHVRALLHPDDLPAALREVARLREGSSPDYRRIERYLHRDGRVVWAEVAVAAVRDDDGRLTHLVGQFQDLTAIKLAQARIERMAAFQERLTQLGVEFLRYGAARDFYGRFLELAVASVPGAQAGSVLVSDDGRAFRFVAGAGYDLALLRRIELSWEELRLSSRSGVQVVRGYAERPLDEERARLFDRCGPTRDILVTLATPIVVAGRPVAVMHLDNFDDPAAFTADAIEMAKQLAQQVGMAWQRARLEEHLAEERAQLRRLAYVDPVTGLANRHRLEKSLALATIDGARRALYLIDLDDFKLVNDSHGHAVGDELLAKLARRLAGLARGDDVLARWSGDEFMLLARLEPDEEPDGRAAAILAALAEPIEVRGMPLRVSASLGADLVGADATAAVRNADTALHEAKAAGKRTYRRFVPAMRRALAERTALTEDLRTALEERAFELHYQPRVRLADGAVVSVEALLRWHHTRRGWVPPERFVPVAEESGLIHALGTWVLDTACAQAASWARTGRRVRVAVNVSQLQLARPDFFDLVAGALARHGVPRGGLELEVTESAVMSDVETSAAQLEALRGLGVGVALDDFGTAYSSLAHLKRLPLETLKIDRSFVADLGPDGGEDASIIAAIVALAGSLGLTTVAEGVETEAQAELLRALGCDEAQGFLYERPLPATPVGALLMRT